MRQRATAQTSIANRGRRFVDLTPQVAGFFASLTGPKLWLDPSDRATLWQDSAGTTPVVAAGDPIGRILDKSGAGILATQATTTSRALWQTTYAGFDGVDDSWATSAIDFTSTDKVTMVVGVRKLSDAADGMVFQLAAANGNFDLRAPGSATAAKFQYASRGATTTAVPFTTSAAYNAPISAVVTSSSDIAAPSAILRVNGVQVSAVVTTQGGGNFSNAILNIGRAGGASLPFNGNLYGLMIIGRLLTADELSLCERYMAQKSGVTL